MLEKLTVVTPVRITSRRQYREARTSMKSFYRAIHPATHLIASANAPRYERKFEALMQSLGANCRSVSPGTTALAGFCAMIEATETEYVFPLLADVMTVTTKDFMNPCIAAMEQDPSLVQVRLCGYPFSMGTTNTDFFSSNGQQVHFKEDPAIALDPIEVGQDVVWTLSMAWRDQKFFYPVPLWSTVLRTSFVRRCLDAVRSQLAAAVTIDDLNGIICGPADPNTCLPGSTRWPAHLAFMQDLRQGSLNLANYMYALGREQKPRRRFRREQMREIQHVPAEGRL